MFIEFSRTMAGAAQNSFKTKELDGINSKPKTLSAVLQRYSVQHSVNIPKP
jgi:hypothetical protein